MKLLISIICLISVCIKANASLLVTPTRVAFDMRDRTSEVVLLNTSGEVKSYRVEWINQRQGESGGYFPLEGQALEEFPKAEEFIRFSPRRITLNPGESQTIKLMVRRKANMTEAEYRSHLKFTALPSESESSAVFEDSPSEGVNVRLNVLLSYSIPVILRTQPVKTDVKMQNLSLQTREDGKEVLTFTMIKNMPNSVFGDFVVTHKNGGEETEIGYLNGVSMFSESNSLNANVVLLTPVKDLGGILTLRYKGKGEFADKINEIASVVIQ